MRRIFGGIMCLVLLSATALPAFAQTSRNRYTKPQTQQKRFDNSRHVHDNRYNRRGQDESFWEENRDLLTVGIGTGAGAVIGGIAGGKKGALIGALIGAGGSALYTYGIRDDDNKDERYRRRR
jgi:hypothetical protein